MDIGSLWIVLWFNSLVDLVSQSIYFCFSEWMDFVSSRDFSWTMLEPSSYSEISFSWLSSSSLDSSSKLESVSLLDSTSSEVTFDSESNYYCLISFFVLFWICIFDLPGSLLSNFFHYEPSFLYNFSSNSSSSSDHGCFERFLLIWGEVNQ